MAVDDDCSQVHFSNKVFGRSIDVDVIYGAAIIPDVLLQTDKDLNVWAFVGTSENGYTKISKTFKVNRRNKPADYVFTPVDQTTIAEIAEIAQSVRDDADAGLFDGKPGENGRDGVDGKDGVPGADGHTPEYGVDYGTPEQIAGIAQSAAEILQPEVEQLRSDLTGITPDDTAVGQKPWTSRKIVETMCQTFAETGNPVQCYPVAGYPLGVKIQIVPIQEGDGDPSQANVREITGTVAVKIVHSNDAGDSNTHDITIPETVYGGTMDFGTGNAEITWAIKTLEVTKFSYNTTINCLLRFNNPLPGIEKPANNTMAAGIKCNKAVSRSASAINGGKSGIGVDINGNIYFRSDGLTSLDDYISAFGDNITVAYKIADPHTIQFDPQQITALPGVNTFYTDADSVIVIGLEDPKHTITELKNAILSLGGNI